MAERAVPEGARPEGAVPAPDLPDERDRDRIRTDLGSTLFVDAGAGSGKTSALVGRVVALVASGEVELAQVAAITFTEKAAAELRDRVRDELVEQAEGHAGTSAAARCATALDQLDAAALGTLHAFAQRILREHPVEAGLPPHLEVLDEVSSAVAFEHRWSVFQDELLADPQLSRSLLLFFATGVPPEALRSLAQVFEDNWDLVEERVAETAPEPPSVHALFAPVIDEARALRTERCADPADKLCQRITALATALEQLGGLGDELDLLEGIGPEARRRMPSFKVGATGSKKAWTDVQAVRSRVTALGERLDAVREVVVTACAHRLAATLRRFTLESAHARRGTGQLQFHDLLVLARALVRDPEHGPAVRLRLHDRYRRLLLDEVQDTDPIQIELAVRIAAAQPGDTSAGRLPWQEVEVAPGHLFLVGDPKQSIYRFRRADIATFLEAADHLGGRRGRVTLTANFRTVQPVIEWVNATFGELMGSRGAPSAGRTPSQPPYVALDPTRPAPVVGPAVAIAGRSAHPVGTRAHELRAAEAAGVAATVARVVQEGWSVGDHTGGGGEGGDGGGPPRSARLGDITILVPTRTSLPFLEAALEDGGIPFRTESSSLVYATRVVRDVLMVARAVDDPSDLLAVVSALRTPLFGCGDDDLFRFARERGGRWDYPEEQPASVPADDPVHAGLRYLRSLFHQRHWLAPSELLDRVARDRRAFELGFVEGRPRDVWRRLRFVVDQARAWHGATGGNLREYLAWVTRQAAESGRAPEAVLPETDDDAVRIMTIHAAKGLEFPVTIVCGLTGGPGGAPATAEAVFPPDDEVAYRFHGGGTTAGFARWQEADEQLELDERIRLLYVACTRARDHLVVSVHRRTRATQPDPARRTDAELLVAGMGAAVLAALPDAVAGAAILAPSPVGPPAPPPPFVEWDAEREAALARAAQPRTVAATSLTEEGEPDGAGVAAWGGPDDTVDLGLRKHPRDLDLPPWLKGRYGSAVGRAVHGALQVVDLATGAGLEAAVISQCEAEAVGNRVADVRRLVAAALGSPTVARAATGRYWREVYVCTPVGEQLLEGYLDLLARTPDGLLIVDYKTAGTSDPAELDRRVGCYRNQGAAYALAAAATSGEAVAGVTFVFLTPEGAVERDLPDLDAAVAHVRRLVAAGREPRAG